MFVPNNIHINKLSQTWNSSWKILNLMYLRAIRCDYNASTLISLKSFFCVFSQLMNVDRMYVPDEYFLIYAHKAFANSSEVYLATGK